MAAEYPKWIGTDPDDPSKGVTVISAEDECALLGAPPESDPEPEPAPAQDVLDLDEETPRKKK